MRFKVSKTSCWEGEIPCEGATKEAVKLVDRREVDNPEKLRMYANHPQGWYGSGSNHRVENNRIARDMKSEAWVIEAESLLDFIRRFGECVVTVTEGEDPEVKVEIYDTWRE